MLRYYASNTLLFEIFLIFARKSSTMRTNLMVTCSAQNAGNGTSGLQISKIFRSAHAAGPPYLCKVFPNATVTFVAGSAPECYLEEDHDVSPSK